MSEQKHTPEPWSAAHEENEAEWGIDAGKWGVAICADAPGDGTAESNARRIVACVNACAGLDTGLLENIVDLGESLRSRFDSFGRVERELTKQRDDLLAALEECRRAMHNYRRRAPRCGLESACDVADKAISNAKGGAA